MYKLCKTEQSSARQYRLEQGLLEAMCLKQYEEISISDLCDSMGIPRKSFYRYFTGKDGALQALVDHTLMEYAGFEMEYCGGKPRTVLLASESFFQFWMEHRRMLDALCRSNLSGMLVSRIVALALEDDAIPARFLPEESKDMRMQITMFCVYGLMSMVMNWRETGYAQPAAEMARIAVRMISQPLFPNVEENVRNR